MTSSERRLARRLRREIKRNQRKSAFAEKYDNYENVIDANNLIKAAKLSRKGVAWKSSVQKYFMSLLRNTWDLRRKLKSGASVVMGFICFSISERGKTRNIRSVHFKERVVQRSLSDNALVPMLSRSLIYDNGASIKGKGIHFAVNRCEKHLRSFYRENGFSNKGWILQVDFSGYFDNIQHEPIRQMIVKNFSDRRLRWLIWQFVKSFGNKSLGIGSQVSQILAVSYPNRIDHYAKEVLCLKHSARYMDDSYFIHRDREYLQYCLAELEKKYSEIGIVINKRKTHIIPVRSFTFLKVRFTLTKTGKVIKKPCQKSVTIWRRNMKAFKRKVDCGQMTMDDVRASYESHRGHMGHLHAHKTIRSMDKLFYELFGIWPTRKTERKCSDDNVDLCRSRQSHSCSTTK